MASKLNLYSFSTTKLNVGGIYLCHRIYSQVARILILIYIKSHVSYALQSNLLARISGVKSQLANQPWLVISELLWTLINHMMCWTAFYLHTKRRSHIINWFPHAPWKLINKMGNVARLKGEPNVLCQAKEFEYYCEKW